jgi:hypothetical protein
MEADMIEKSQYIDLIRKIIAESMPEEQALFELSGERVADNLYRTGMATPQRGGQVDEFLFIDEAKNILQFILLMTGTFEALRKIYDLLKSRHQISKKEMEAEWRETLTAAGLSAEVAATIVRRFENDLAEKLRK